MWQPGQRDGERSRRPQSAQPLGLLAALNARILLSRMNPQAEGFGEPLAMPSCFHPSQPDEVAEALASLDVASPVDLGGAPHMGQGGSCLRRTRRSWAQR